MKITKVDVMVLDAGAQAEMRKPICCRIYTDEGIYGDGEVWPMAPVGGRPTV